MEEISDAERKYQFCKDMTISVMSKHAFSAPPPRLNFANVATVSIGKSTSPAPALADTGCTSAPGISTISGPMTPATGST